jgi:hypothetical protein
MARKVLNRKELRAQGDAAEAAGEVEEKPAKKTAAKRPTARKSRAKTAKALSPMKAYWGVHNQTGKVVVVFEYSEQKQAEKKATELNASQKTPHYVAVIKKAIE